jgi:hypothetical protein
MYAVYPEDAMPLINLILLYLFEELKGSKDSLLSESLASLMVCCVFRVFSFHG